MTTDLLQSIKRAPIPATAANTDLRPLFAALGIPPADSVVDLHLHIMRGRNGIELTYTRLVTQDQIDAVRQYFVDHPEPLSGQHFAEVPFDVLFSQEPK